MRRSVVVAAAILVLSCFGGLAADVFQTYGLDRERWIERFEGAAQGSGFYLPETAAKLKTLPPAERAIVVNALGAAVKAYFATPAFRTRYQKTYQANMPEALKPPRTKAQIAAELRAEAQKGIADAEAMLKNVEGEMKQTLQEGIKAIRDNMAQIDQMAAEMAEMEKQQHEEALSQPPDPDAMPQEPSAGLKRSLGRFLSATAGVDHAAKLRPQSGKQVFVDPEFESKPSEWKLCYRAGREACEAARSFASAWLTELK